MTPLRAPAKLFGSIPGVLTLLRDTPAEGCALIIKKHEALNEECARIEKSLGI